ncbi:unnamed protein product [Pleuronectes platessa]|uniref:Uncharacterized protein n=1 Tax=Pleuronectes platessa TaxID=8262 RepID=A0A9N7UWG2_PLEPL|nr:unnamed protein product [Pleuronectes platessa]
MPEKSTKIIKDHSHPGCGLLTLLPSGRRYRSIQARTTRLKNSFFPQATGPRSTIQTRRHSRPQSPSTAAHQEPPRSWSTARTQCQRGTGSATSTTISPHDTESATLDPPLRPPVRDPQTAIPQPRGLMAKSSGFYSTFRYFRDDK